MDLDKLFKDWVLENQEDYVGMKNREACIAFAKEALKKQCAINGVVKSFTYNDICKVAEELANNYNSDKKDPVWRDIRQDGINAIQAFVKNHL